MISVINSDSNKAFIDIAGSGYASEFMSVESHSAEPIRTDEEILMVSNHLVKNGRYRDNALFWMGISFGVRCGDLVKFKFGDVVDADGNWIDKVEFVETKTKNTRAKMKNRIVYLTPQVKQALELYCDGRQVSRDDYIFPAHHNGKHFGHLTTQAVDQMLKKTINKELGLPYHASTHTLRKTFAYHILTKAENQQRALTYLQTIFNHSSAINTLYYSGVMADEIRALSVDVYHGISATGSHKDETGILSAVRADMEAAS